MVRSPISVAVSLGDLERSDCGAPSHTFASPKSSTLTAPLRAILIFAGLRSR